MQPVVLIHGMWSTPDTLASLKEVFEAERFDVHCPALPFHHEKHEMDNAAREGLKQCGVNEYVEAISDYVDQLPQAPIIVGHSMGGLIAQLVASKVDCRALVTVSSAPPAGINGWSWSVIRTFGHNLFRFPLWKSLTELGLNNVRYGIANTQPSEVHRDIFSRSTYESGLASFQIGMWFLFRKPPTKVDTSSVECPVLVMGGTEDKITPIKVQRKIARQFGEKATLVELPDACHWTIADGHLPSVSQHLFDWLKHIELTQTEL